MYRELAWQAPEMAVITRAIDRMLENQEPFPALVMDRYWNVLKTNKAMQRFCGDYIDLSLHERPHNLLRIIFSPEGLQPFFVNWEEAASALLERVRRDTVSHFSEEKTTELLKQLSEYPGVRSLERLHEGEGPVIPFTLRRGNQLRSSFVLTTTVGTPLNISTQELRIDTLFPTDESSVDSESAL